MHLLRRHVTVPRPVSSLMFFERGMQSSTRHHRLKYLLLFALRVRAGSCWWCLRLPIRLCGAWRPMPNGRMLLIVLDNSFSMRAGTRFADAKQRRWRNWLRGRNQQKAQIMALGGQLQMLTQPITDSAQLRAALESMQP